MKDLRSQLADALGVQAPEPGSDQPTGILDEGAHLDSEWFRLLLQLSSTTLGAAPVPEDAKLARARQATDLLVKRLKKAGRKRPASQLADARKDWLSRRDKAAWSQLKSRFRELGLSEKAYRAIKQGGADPMAVLQRLERTDQGELESMGATRLRAHLLET